MASYYDRYGAFRTNGEVKPLPFISLDVNSSDKRVVYKVGVTRLDVLSQTYYGNPYHGFLIMLANSRFGGIEFNIPDGEIITIPFPFKRALEDYQNKVREYQTLYGG
jgi:hypothetical protein